MSDGFERLARNTIGFLFFLAVVFAGLLIGLALTAGLMLWG